MKVREIMTGSVVSVSQLEPVSAAARLMQRHNLGALPVCDDDGRLRGFITDRDIVTRCVAADLTPDSTKIREIMSRGITTCDADVDVGEAIRAMGEHQVRRLPVMEGGRVAGMVSLGDLVRSGRCDLEAAEALCEITAGVSRK